MLFIFPKPTLIYIDITWKLSNQSVLSRYYHANTIMLLQGLKWDLAGKLARQVVTFMTSLVLARLLGPEMFGQIGMVMVVIVIAQVFVDVGLNSGIIQRKEVNEEMISTVFWLNLGMSLLLTIVCFLSAKEVSAFYEVPALENITKALSLLFVLGGLSGIQRSLLVKRLDFKALAKVSFVASIFSGIVGITLAYLGWGVWSLVSQQLVQQSVMLVLLWTQSSWRPNWVFQGQALRDLWGFSGYQLADTMLAKIVSQLDVLVIGKVFTQNTLGLYTRAKTLDNFIINYSSDSLSRVIFPVISVLQENAKEVKRLLMKALQIAAFVSVGLSGWLFLIAEDLVVFLFGSEWTESGRYYRYLAVVAFTYPISSIMISVLVGLGGAKDNFLVGLIRKSLRAPIILLAYFYGIEVFLMGLIVGNVIGTILNSWTLAKRIKISTYQLLVDTLGIITLGSIIALCMFFFLDLVGNMYLRLLVFTILFWCAYVAGSIWLGVPILPYLRTGMEKVSEIRGKRKA